MKGTVYKRSLWGYHPGDVDKLFSRMNDQYKIKLAELKSSFAAEVHQLQLLKIEIKRLQDDINSYNGLKTEIAGRLMGFHMKSSEVVYNTAQEADQKDIDSADNVVKKRNELNNMKLVFDKLREEVGMLTDQYRVEIEKIGRD